MADKHEHPEGTAPHGHMGKHYGGSSHKPTGPKKSDPFPPNPGQEHHSHAPQTAPRATLLAHYGIGKAAAAQPSKPKRQRVAPLGGKARAGVPPVGGGPGKYRVAGTTGRRRRTLG